MFDFSFVFNSKHGIEPEPYDQETGPSKLSQRLLGLLLGTGKTNWSSGSLSNDDVDVNENGKKAIGLDWQNNNFARASRFFVYGVKLRT